MLKFEVIPVTQFAQNCSLIWCDETHQAALIDPGGEADKLLAAIAKRGLTLTHILLTHGHLDHVGAAAELRRRPAWPSQAPTRKTPSGSTCCPSRARCSASPIPLPLAPTSGWCRVTRCSLASASWRSTSARPHPGPYRAALPGRKTCLGRRCAVCRQHRPHRLPPWRSRDADQVDHRNPAATGGRDRLYPGPRPQLHLRSREGEQPLPDPAYLVIKKGSGVSRNADQLRIH